MYPEALQDDLVKDLQELFEGYKLEAPDAKYVTRDMQVFAQELPIPEQKVQEDIPPEMLENGLAGDITDNNPYPYIIVRVRDGEIKDMRESQTVNILLLVGIYDNGDERQGHRKVLDIIAKIYDRYAKKPVIVKKHRLLWPVEWTLQDEEGTHPYYYGGMITQWETAGIEVEDRYA